MSNIIWQHAPQPGDQYALVVANPEEVDSNRLKDVFARVKNAKGGRREHLSWDAVARIESWLSNLSMPLPSRAYALLSNWFLTEATVDRETSLGQCCGDLWDELFNVPPAQRLTEREPNHNTTIIDIRFHAWWKKQEASQRR